MQLNYSVIHVHRDVPKCWLSKLKHFGLEKRLVIYVKNSRGLVPPSPEPTQANHILKVDLSGARK